MTKGTRMSIQSHRRRVAAVALAAGAALLAGAAPAAAHIQVRPAEAAPGDPVLWTVLVPNERDLATTKVELAIPKGVIPFSYEPLPGWTRTLTKNPNQSVRSIVWSGNLKPSEVLVTQFLATTPDQAGPISWKAIQTSSDGQKVRWIGGPGSEEPASVTQISASAPRQNAGGEGDESAAAVPAAAPDVAGDDGGSGDGLAVAALIVGGLGLATGIAALVLGRRRTRT